jgi:hypothetical protein
MNKALVIFSIAIGHLLLSVGVMVKVFSMGMRRFDSLDPASANELFLQKLRIVLWMPLAHPFKELAKHWRFFGPVSGLLGYAALFLNSFLWGYAIWWCYSFIDRKRKRSAV